MSNGKLSIIVEKLQNCRNNLNLVAMNKFTIFDFYTLETVDFCVENYNLIKILWKTKEKKCVFNGSEQINKNKISILVLHSYEKGTRKIIQFLVPIKTLKKC